jgi:hypothetical protein
MRLRTAPRTWRASAAVLLLLSISLPLGAQTADAVIVAVVRSAAGAPVAGAVVTVRDQSSGFSARGRTGAEGRFVFRQLPLGGPYTVSASRIGFAPRQQTGYDMALGSRVEVALRLPDQSVTWRRWW